ncbi:hypothetical protein AGIG_G10203 [Arapaima gigas]
MNCEGSRYSGSFAPSTELTCDPSLEFPKTFVQTPGALWRPHTSGGGFQSKQQVSLLTHSWTDTMPDLPRDKRNILNYNVYGSEETVAGSSQLHSPPSITALFCSASLSNQDHRFSDDMDKLTGYPVQPVHDSASQ